MTKQYKRLPNGLTWEISYGNAIYEKFIAIAVDLNEPILSHRYKTGSWTGKTLQEAKNGVLKELSRRKYER